ncbi:MAG: hypothetical protein FJY67_02775 [Calditrichaeota bacterium]|nr:hypothetical protein [Calditrichota bacterium]
MRITQQGVIRGVVEQAQRRFAAMSEAQQQMTTGRAVDRPSDAPASIPEVLSLQSRLAAIGRFRANAQAAVADLQEGEQAVQQLRDLLTRVQSAAQQGANDATGENGRRALAQQIDTELETLAILANERSGTRYRFGNSASSTAPYRIERDEGGRITAVSPAGENPLPPTELRVGEGERVTTGLSAAAAFDLDDEGDQFQMLIALRDALQTNDGDTVRNALPRIRTALDQASDLTALVGSRISRAQQLAERYSDENLRAADRLSQLTDVDAVEAITRFSVEQSAYELALRAASRVVQPTLLAFLT